MVYNDLLAFAMRMVYGVLVILVATFIGLVYKGLDRKLAARMQARIGPPIRQPFRDVGKLLIKENIVPENAVSWMFNAAPLFAMATAGLALLYMPFFCEPVLEGYGDAILVLYLFMLPSLAMVVGGFASGSPFATVGAQREMVMMMSYEFPLAVAIISIVWRLSLEFPHTEDIFSLRIIAEHPLWGVVGPLGKIGYFVLFMVLLLVTPGKLAKIPFDVPEAETEIAGGLLVEYSGRNLALFYLADAVKTVAFITLLIVLFVPYNLSPLISAYIGLPMSSLARFAMDAAFFLLKIFIIMFFLVTTVRVGFARLKIDQVSNIYWVMMTAMAFVGLGLIYLDVVLG